MFDIPLRQFKDTIFIPIAKFTPDSITPGHITFLAFLCGFGCCLSASMSANVLALLLWFTNRTLDCLDGSLARHRKNASELGGFLDLLSDFVVYSLLPIAIAWGQYGEGRVEWLAISLLEASFHVNNFILFYSAAVAAGKADGELTSVTMRPALIEGFESGLFFTAMLILPGNVTELAWVMAVGIAIGICQRGLAVAHVLSRSSQRRQE